MSLISVVDLSIVQKRPGLLVQAQGRSVRLTFQLYGKKFVPFVFSEIRQESINRAVQTQSLI